ncbi:MAG: Mrp/NBP35 family ATP-binding protein, partial [Bacteroidales bacterium]|nr:Mrp/NBP35 family ATP-binding protein [Bacteroidales bacterium]
YIFGKDGCKAMSEKFDIPVLAQIPIVQSIRESGDNGSPVALTERADSIAFRKLARKIIDMHA